MELEFGQLLQTHVGENVRTVLAHVAGAGNTGDNANAEQDDGVEVMQPVGLVARPVIDDDSEAVYVRSGNELVCIGFIRKSATLHDCEAGETQLYSDQEPTCRIRLRANGDVEVWAKAGAKVYLGGTDGTQPVGLGTAIKDQLDEIRTKFNVHQHVETGGTTNVVDPLQQIGATPNVESGVAFVKP